MLYVDAVGVTIGIDLSVLGPDDAAAVRTAWSDAAAPGGDESAPVVVPLSAGRARMLQSLSRQVTRAAIDARRSDLWMLHAAGVATPTGDVVAFVGPSGRGKTTASRHLGQQYGYVSDETIGIDRDGRVFAYRKPLSIIEQPGSPKVERGPSSVGLGTVPHDLRVRAIVLLHRDSGHEGPPRVDVIDLGDALDDLVSQSSHLVERPDALRFIAALADATGGIRSVRYREAEDLSAVMPALLTGSPTRPVVAPAVVHPTGPGTRTAEEPVYVRAAAVDEVTLPSPVRVAVLTRGVGGRGTVHVLAGIAPALWAAASGVPLDVLVDAATATYGVPEDGDAEQFVRAAVEHLVAEGLLLVTPTAERT